MNILRPFAGQGKIIPPLLLVALLLAFPPATPCAGYDPPVSHSRPKDDGARTLRVEKVLDGDTFVSETGGRVRVLGIDTPEMHYGGPAPEPFAEAARERLRELAEGERVTVTRDGDGQDTFHRRLGYVTLPDGRDLGELLLREGLAMVYVADFQRLEDYLALEREARAQGRGIWGDPRNRSVAAAMSHGQHGNYRLVRGTIAQVDWRGAWLRLTFARQETEGTEGAGAEGSPVGVWLGALTGRRDRRAAPAVAVIHREAWREAFGPGGSPQERYLGRAVEVRGRIKLHRGQPEIKVRHPRQITLLEGP